MKPFRKSPKQTSNSEISLTPSKGKTPGSKIVGAPAGAKDEEEIIVEKVMAIRKRTSLILHLILSDLQRTLVTW